MSNRIVLWSLGIAAVAILAAMPLMKDDPTKQQQVLVTAGGFAAGFLLFWLYQRSNSKEEEWDPMESRGTGSTSTKSTGPLKNVWEVGQSKGAAKKEKNHDDKPFGSKYYYAHNNSKATGGYKDGLKMEDYRMNGPRLLSKGGSSVGIEDDGNTTEDPGAAQEEPTSKTAPTSFTTKISINDANVRNITKYLWDDPGDSNGIATIRIDVLPDKRPGEFINWKDIEPSDVDAKLAGEGLLVKISLANDPDKVKYQLKIPKLYGDAADVKCVVKSKRLLVKIHKKKKSYLSMNKGSNLDAWPQPHRKI